MTSDLQLPRDLDPIEGRLRATLAAVAATTPVDDAGDPTMVVAAPEAPPVRPRRWPAGVAAAAAVAVGAVAVVGGVLSEPDSMVAMRGDDPVTTIAPSASAPATGAPVDYLLPDVLPAGFREAFVGRSASPVRAVTSMDVYTAGGDHLADRALVVLRSTEPAAFGSILSFDGGARATVGGRIAVSASAGPLQGLELGQGGDGVAVIGRGLDEEELRTAASALVTDGEVNRGIPDGLDLVYQGRHPLIEAPTDDVVFGTYATDDGLRELEVRTVTGGAAPIESVAWQFEGERRGVTLRGTQGVLVTIVDPDSGRSYRQLVWSEGNVTVSVGGRGVTEDEVVAFARSLRPATRTEVDRLVEQSAAAVSED